MANLTSADVRKVAFNKAPIGRRGYHEEEVDAFLDQVESTIAALTDQIEALHTQLRAGPSAFAFGDPAPGGTPDNAVLVELDLIKTRLARIETAVNRSQVRQAGGEPVYRHRQ